MDDRIIANSLSFAFWLQPISLLAGLSLRRFRRIFKPRLYSWILARRVTRLGSQFNAMLPRYNGHLRLLFPSVGGKLLPLHLRRGTCQSVIWQCLTLMAVKLSRFDWDFSRLLNQAVILKYFYSFRPTNHRHGYSMCFYYCHYRTPNYHLWQFFHHGNVCGVIGGFCIHLFLLKYVELCGLPPIHPILENAIHNRGIYLFVVLAGRLFGWAFQDAHQVLNSSRLNCRRKDFSHLELLHRSG